MVAKMHAAFPAEYTAWSGMNCRCNNPAVLNYANYGGRGIKVCARWSSFKHFLSDMGRKPTPQHSLDRVNNEGNYEPENCRWATRAQQNNNKRNQRMVTIAGFTLTLTEAWRAMKSPAPFATVKRRLDRGWDLMIALKTPKLSADEVYRRQCAPKQRRVANV